MSDYTEGAAGASGTIGTPGLILRQDAAQLGSLVTANQQLMRMQGDSAGALRVSQEGGKATYIVNGQFTIDSTGTNIWFITGSATKIVKLLWLELFSAATSAVTGRIKFVRQSAVDTAGTVVTETPQQLDGNDAAATAVVKHYTVHPSALGTAVGNVYSANYGQQAVNTVPISRLAVDFRSLYGAKCLRLSGITDILAINAVAALAAAGNLWDVNCCFVEEPLTA